MAIPDSFLDELVGRTDIVDVVSQYVALNKRSGGNLFGLCPFHNEKTPSFSVNSDKQIYHCFGCGKGGGVINFIMEIENLSFPDAVEVLAKRAGMRVPDTKVSEDQSSRRARMFEVNRAAARFFHDMLGDPRGQPAVEYLNKRGISKAMVTRFGIGAAPDAWTALCDELTEQGYHRQELIEAGLVKESKKEGASGVYDTFRNRLMFPVIDVRGNVIGFSGRILSDGEPKYLNSPETLVFNKSRNLFGMNLAKKSKAGNIILVEGNIDVVSLHQAGFDSAVASLGTSLTEDQVKLIRRYTENIVVAYDADDAGKKASQRAIGLLEKTGMGVKVITLPGAKDPDEYIKKNGPESFKRLLERSENHIEYQLLSIQNACNLDTDEGKLQYLRDSTALLAKLDSPVEREIYGVKVAQAAGISTEAVKNEIKKAVNGKYSRQKKAREREVMRPAAEIQPSDRAIKYKNEFSAVAEEGIIRCLVRDPELFSVVQEMGLEDEEFTSPFLGKVFALLRRRYSEGRDFISASITAELTQAEAAQYSRIIQKPETAALGRQTVADYIERIRTERLKSSAESDRDLLTISLKYREKKGVGG